MDRIWCVLRYRSILFQFLLFSHLEIHFSVFFFFFYCLNYSIKLEMLSGKRSFEIVLQLPVPLNVKGADVAP